MALTKIFGVLSMAGVVTLTAYGMGCSSSSNKGGGTTQDSGPAQTGDSGNKTDGSTKDSGGPVSDSSASQDQTGSQSDSGDSGSCASSTPFMMLTWAPPTPFTPGACTAAEISQYNSQLTSTTASAPPTSGSATCDACLQTDVTKSAHGPVITQAQMGMEIPVSINFGGCVANEDGLAADKTSTGCGAQLNNFQDCFGQECGTCSDANDPKMGGPTESCLASACSKEQLTMACDTELNTDGGIQTCLGTLTQIFTAWCGGSAGPTDGGTTETGPAETGPADGATEQ